VALRLVGLGLGSPRYLTEEAVRVMRSSEVVYLDRYTGFVSEELLDLLRSMIGDRLREAGRATLEDSARSIVEEAADKDVCVAVPGDPLVATTHVSLLVLAARRGVEWSVVYGVSVLSAAASASGLTAYKFGRAVTIPRSPTHEVMEGIYRSILENTQRGLHTLILLDTAGQGMSAGEAAAHLLEAEERLRYGLLVEDRLFIALARLGMSEERRLASRLGELGRMSLPPPPHLLILPGELHFHEREALKELLGAEPSLVDTHRSLDPSRARAERYIDSAQRVLSSVREQVARGSAPEDPLELAESYVYDARVFLSSGRVEDSLVSVAYAEGILDCLRRLGLVRFEW